jgi:hypothetical protein
VKIKIAHSQDAQKVIDRGHGISAEVVSDDVPVASLEPPPTMEWVEYMIETLRDRIIALEAKLEGHLHVST